MTPHVRNSLKIVLVFIFIVIVWWLVSTLDSDFVKKPIVSPIQQETSTSTIVGKSVAPPTSERAIESLITQQVSFVCNFGDTVSSHSATILYVANGSLRLESNGKVGKTIKTTNYVYDGRFLYTWVQNAIAGKKMAVTSLSELPNSIPADFTSGNASAGDFSADGWTCENRLFDSQLLIPPKNIKFTF